MILVTQESSNTWSVKWEADVTNVGDVNQGMEAFSLGAHADIDSFGVVDGGILFEIVGTLLAPAYMMITPPTEITFDGGGDSKTYYQLDIIT